MDPRDHRRRITLDLGCRIFLALQLPVLSINSKPLISSTRCQMTMSPGKTSGQSKLYLEATEALSQLDSEVSLIRNVCKPSTNSAAKRIRQALSSPEAKSLQPANTPCTTASHLKAAAMATSSPSLRTLASRRSDVLTHNHHLSNPETTSAPQDRQTPYQVHHPAAKEVSSTTSQSAPSPCRPVAMIA